MECRHELDRSQCSWCREPRKRQRIIVRPPQILDPDLGDERLLIEEPDEDYDPEEREPPEEAPFNRRHQRATGRKKFLWDLRDSDTDPVVSRAPKASKPTRLLSPSIPEEEEKRAPNPVVRAREFAWLKSKGWTTKAITELFGVSESLVSQHLSLLKLVPEVQALMDPARKKSPRLNLTVSAALSSLPMHLQENCAREVLDSGWKTRQAIQYVRMRAQQSRDAAKLPRPAG